MHREALRGAYDLKGLACLLAEAIATAPSLTHPHGGPRMLHRTVEAACDAVGKVRSGARWTAADAAAARSTLRLAVRSGAAVQAVDASHAALGAVRLAHDILSGAPVSGPDLAAVIRTWDRRHPVARHLVGAFRAVAAEARPDAPGAGVAVPAAFAWSARKPGSVARERRIGTVPVMLGALGDHARPVLRLVGGDGKPFELLECGGTLFRPVFAPGSWEPLRASRFADAVSGAEAWVDAPHCPPIAGGGVVLAPSDACAPDLVENAGQETARAEAAGAAVARAGRLGICGGVVHREVGAPWLVVDAGTGWDFTWRDPTCDLGLGWAFPDGLASGTDMSTACRDPVPRRRPLDGLSVSPGLGAHALAAVEASVAERAGSRDSRFRLSIRPGIPAEVLDPDVFPASVDDILAASRALPSGPPVPGSSDLSHAGLPDGASLARHLARQADAMRVPPDPGLAGFRP